MSTSFTTVLRIIAAFSVKKKDQILKWYMYCLINVLYEREESRVRTKYRILFNITFNITSSSVLVFIVINNVKRFVRISSPLIVWTDILRLWVRFRFSVLPHIIVPFISAINASLYLKRYLSYHICKWRLMRWYCRNRGGIIY